MNPLTYAPILYTELDIVAKNWLDIGVLTILPLIKSKVMKILTKLCIEIYYILSKLSFLPKNFPPQLANMVLI